MQDPDLHHRIRCLRTLGPDKGRRQNTRCSRGGAGLQKVAPVELAHVNSSFIGNVRRTSRQSEKSPLSGISGQQASLPPLASTLLSSAEKINAHAQTLAYASALLLMTSQYPGQRNACIFDQPMGHHECKRGA